jgi:TP901 family phage tail tape measure protein
VIRELRALIRMVLDPASARNTESQMQESLRRGTDPTVPEQNLSRVESKFDSLTKKVKEFGITLTALMVGRMVKRFVEDAVSSFLSFDQAMTRSLAIMGNVSAGMRKQMEDVARALSIELNIPAEKVAEGFYFLASAGLSAEQAIQALPVVAKFAKAGMMDLAQATEMLVDSQSALGMTSSDATKNMQNLAKIADVLTMAANKTDASIEQFASALEHRAAATMRQFNIPMEEGVAVLMAYAQQGTKAQLAGEEFMRLVARLTDAVTRHASAFKQLNIQIFDPKNPDRLRPLAQIVADLTERLGKMSLAGQVATMQAMGFTLEAQNAIRPLMGQADAIREYEKELTSAGGATQDIADNQMKSFSEQIGQLTEKFKDLKREMGRDFVEGAAEGAKSASGFNTILDEMRFFLNLNTGYMKGLASGAVYLASVIGGALILVLGSLGTILNVLGTELEGLAKVSVALLTTAITGLEYAFSGLFEVLHQILSLGGTAENPLSKFFDQAATSAKNAAAAVWDYTKRISASATGDLTLAGMRADLSGGQFNAPGGPARPNMMEAAVKAQIAAADEAERKRKKRIEDAAIASDAALKKQASFMKQFNDEIARQTGTAYDIALQRIQDLEDKAHEIFGKKLPEAVRQGLQQMRAAAGEEENVRQGKAGLQLINTEAPQDEELALHRLQQLIANLKLEREQVGQNKQARAQYDELIAQAEKDEIATELRLAKAREKGIKDFQESLKNMEEDWKNHHQLIFSVAQDTALNVASAWGDALMMIGRHGMTMMKFIVAAARGMAAALLQGLAQFAAGKVAENVASAFEEHARAVAAMAVGIGELNPAAIASAGIHEAAAHAHEVAAAEWALLAGLAGSAAGAIGSAGGGGGGANGGGSAATDVGGNTSQQGTKNGPNITFVLREFDPLDPRAQEKLAEARIEYEERTGGTVNITRG